MLREVLTEARLFLGLALALAFDNFWKGSLWGKALKKKEKRKRHVEREREEGRPWGRRHERRSFFPQRRS
jgi:hypothetical protein